MFKTTLYATMLFAAMLFAALLIIAFFTDDVHAADWTTSKADTMQTPSGIYDATTKQGTDTVTTNFTPEDAASVATKVSDLLEYGELNNDTAALARNDNMPHLNTAVDDYVRALRHLETKRRVLENELIRIDQENF